MVRSEVVAAAASEFEMARRWRSQIAEHPQMHLRQTSWAGLVPDPAVE